jgi:hypothetical protein
VNMCEHHLKHFNGVQLLSMPTKSKKTPDRFWAWLDQLEADRGLTDSGVAKLAKLSRSVFSNARNEVRPIGADAAVRVADALGQPRFVVLQLIGLIDEEETIPVLDVEMAEAWGRLSTADREEILAMIRVKVKRERAGGSQKAGR